MKTYKILIIDDDVQAINFVIDTLETANPNYVFYHAVSGIAGIESARKHIPNLILTDWEMPGLSGIETTRQLKSNEKTKNIPIIMISGIMTKSENLETALDAGAIDYIRKPFDPIELRSRTHSMLMLADYYNETIDLKNRELASTAMTILQNNEFHSKLLEKITVAQEKNTAENTELTEILSQISDTISAKLKGEAWEHFEIYFKNVHPDFFMDLSKQFPELSPADLKLAAFIKLGLNSKEIASIIFISPESVRTARFRLRKKLDLGRDENLTSFLNQI